MNREVGIKEHLNRLEKSKQPKEQREGLHSDSHLGEGLIKKVQLSSPEGKKNEETAA